MERLSSGGRGRENSATHLHISHHLPTLLLLSSPLSYCLPLLCQWLSLALTQRDLPGVRTVLTVIISITAAQNSCYSKPKEGPVALHLSPVQTGVCHSPMHIMIGTLFQFMGVNPTPCESPPVLEKQIISLFVLAYCKTPA